MAVTIDDLEHAFLFVSSNGQYMNQAFLCKETGKIYFSSELVDCEEEMPEDIEDADRYILIPHQNELDLGKMLVFDFVLKFLPNDVDRVESFFNKRGAYARFKDLVEDRDHLNDWYAFENERTRTALRQWCAGNNIELKD